MKIGFTGTQQGMTQMQRIIFASCVIEDLTKLLETMTDFDLKPEFHHGQCIGADHDAHDIVSAIFKDRIRMVIHPPENLSKAFRVAANSIKATSTFRQPKPYLDRNKDIVDESDILYVLPQSKEEELRSGTWSTCRYARKMGKPRKIIYPDGLVSFERGSIP